MEIEWTELRISDCGLRIADLKKAKSVGRQRAKGEEQRTENCELWIANCGLRIADSKRAKGAKNREQESELSQQRIADCGFEEGGQPAGPVKAHDCR